LTFQRAESTGFCTGPVRPGVGPVEHGLLLGGHRRSVAGGTAGRQALVSRCFCSPGSRVFISGENCFIFLRGFISTKVKSFNLSANVLTGNRFHVTLHIVNRTILFK